MSTGKYERMIRLAEETFAVKNDPEQLDVDQEIIKRLQRIHPATVSEYNEGDGPIAWVLLIPTTRDLMDLFLNKRISEKELFEKTPLDGVYKAVYLCSAMVLEEYRRTGIAKRLALSAIESIRNDHSIDTLFAWAFTKEGDLLAGKIAQLAGLPLYKRPV